MRNISDIIEGYLKAIIEEEQNGTIEIKRSEVAEKFQCVPSQINYVIKTRFTEERGYAVESKRGGGGYIRIFRVQTNSRKELIEHILEGIQQGASYTMAEDVVYQVDGRRSHYGARIETDSRRSRLGRQSINRFQNVIWSVRAFYRRCS